MEKRNRRHDVDFLTCHFPMVNQPGLQVFAAPPSENTLHFTGH